MKFLSPLFLALLLSGAMLSVAQTETEPAPATVTSAPGLNKQLEDIVSSASSWTDYWLIKKSTLNDIQRQLADTLQLLQQNRLASLNDRAALEGQLKKTEDLLAEAEQANQSLSKELNSIGVFGMLVNKNLYQSIVVGLLLLLLASTAFFFVQYRSRNGITSKVQKTLKETQEEFDQFKKRAIEREQKLKRELQDELNKRSS